MIADLEYKCSPSKDNRAMYVHINFGSVQCSYEYELK